MEGPEQRNDLLMCLNRLSERERRLLVLRFVADRSVEETAAILKLSPNGTKTATRRALSRARSVIEEGDEDRG
jgi:RNA polymerase sigma factor (sigma-70 family)